MAPESLEGESRTLFTLLLIAGGIGLFGGIVELFLFSQFGPGPYFTVSLSTAVLLVTLLFVRPSPALPLRDRATSATEERAPVDLPDPLSASSSPLAPDLPPGPADPGRGEGSPSFPPHPLRTRLEAAGTASASPESSSEKRPWQVQPLPVPAGGGFVLPRTSEGILATLDRLADELTRPVPGGRTASLLEAPEPTEPHPSVSHLVEDILVHPHLGRGSSSSPRPPEGSSPELPALRPLHLPTEKELLRGLGPGSPRSLSDPVPTLKPVSASDLPMGMEEIRGELEKLRRAFLSGPRRVNASLRRPSRAPAHTSPPPTPTPYRPTPRPSPPAERAKGKEQAHVSEDDLQVLLDDLEVRLESPSRPPSSIGSSPVSPDRSPSP